MADLGAAPPDREGQREAEVLTRAQAWLVDNLTQVLAALPPGAERYVDAREVSRALAEAQRVAPCPRLEELPIAPDALGQVARLDSAVPLPLPPLQDASAWKEVRKSVHFALHALESFARRRAKLRKELPLSFEGWRRGP